jgi:hypothetical protein
VKPTAAVNGHTYALSNGTATVPAVELRTLICEVTRDMWGAVYPGRVRALVLTGSLARDEATFVRDGDCWRLLGDAEFLAVFHRRAPLPPAADAALITAKIAERLARRGLDAEVTVATVRPRYLRRLPPSIFGYELARCGRVVLGDETVLDLLSPMSPSDVPLDDAWRLLANRMVEQLADYEELARAPAILSPQCHYRTVKLYLDMATSLLVFAGAYAPTYRERASNLVRLAESRALADSLFPLTAFAETVLRCTEWKVSPSWPESIGRQFWQDAVAAARVLWPWELARLAGRHATTPSAALLAAWTAHEHPLRRLRGWAHVARHRGWHRAWCVWPGWAASALRTSPRHLVYAAASAMLFSLHSWLVSGQLPAEAVEDLKAQHARLPVAWAGPDEAGEKGLACIARDILANYREFLVGTYS